MSQREIIATPQLVQTRLVQVIEKITELFGRVIVETKTDIRPTNGLYVSLYFNPIEFLPQNEARYKVEEIEAEEVITQTQTNEALQSVKVNFWGKDAYFQAINLYQELQNWERIADLWDIIGYSGISAVQDLSSDFGGKIQQRASFDFSFYVAYERKYIVEPFEVAQWTIASPENNNYSEEYEQGDKPDEPNCNMP